MQNEDKWRVFYWLEGSFKSLITMNETCIHFLFLADAILVSTENIGHQLL